MILINNKNLNKKYVIGGSGLVDTAVKSLVKVFTRQGAEELASTAAKEIGKSALGATRSVAVDASKQLINKIINPPKKSKLEEIMNKYSTTVDI